MNRPEALTSFLGCSYFCCLMMKMKTMTMTTKKTMKRMKRMRRKKNRTKRKMVVAVVYWGPWNHFCCYCWMMRMRMRMMMLLLLTWIYVCGCVLRLHVPLRHIFCRTRRRIAHSGIRTLQPRKTRTIFPMTFFYLVNAFGSSIS